MEVSRDNLLYVSKELGNDWKKLGRTLGLEESKLNDLIHEYSKDGPEEIRYQMLIAWQQKAGLEATNGNLLYALQCIERNDLVEYLSAGNLKRIYPCLRKEYKILLLPKDRFLKQKELPITDFFVNPILKEKNLFGYPDKSENLCLTEIFKAKGGMQSKRILVEGDTGYGKTTLITKLANDWSNDKEYIKHFSMVFIIFLRGFKQNFEEYLLDIFAEKVKILARENIQETLKLNESRTLLLLDGYEELSESGKEEIIPLLRGDLYPEMTVLMTSNPEVFYDQGIKPSGQNDNFFLEEGIKIDSAGLLSVWDKRIHIKGIADKQREEFLEKYLEQKFKDIRKSFPYLFSKEIKELFHCPLFLFNLAVVIEEIEKNYMMNKFKMLRIIIGYAIRRNLLKNKLINEHNGIKNVLDHKNDLNDILEDYRYILTEFGRYVFTRLHEEHLCFNEKELFSSCRDAKSILKMGFLIKRIKRIKNERHVVYGPVHQSILHFIGAFSPPSIVSRIQKGLPYSNTDVDFLVDHVTFLPNQNLFLLESLSEIAPRFFSILELEKIGLFPASYFCKLFNQPIITSLKWILLSLMFLFCVGIFALLVWADIQRNVHDIKARQHIDDCIISLYLYAFLCLSVYSFLQILCIMYYRMFFYFLRLFLSFKERYSFIPTYILLK